MTYLPAPGLRRYPFLPKPAEALFARPERDSRPLYHANLRACRPRPNRGGAGRGVIRDLRTFPENLKKILDKQKKLVILIASLVY
jgi:hypothetical protein